MEKRSLGK